MYINYPCVPRNENDLIPGSVVAGWSFSWVCEREEITNDATSPARRARWEAHIAEQARLAAEQAALEAHILAELDARQAQETALFLLGPQKTTSQIPTGKRLLDLE